jgi:hypothetical protein
MKALLRGGPLDGKIVDVRRNCTMTGERIMVFRNGKVARVEDYEYQPAGYERHPCKKRGLTRVFQYTR